MKPTGRDVAKVNTSTKSRKSSREKDKKRAHSSSESNNYNYPERGLVQKVSNGYYAGVDSESVVICGQQCGIENLSEDITDILAENINYKLREIINDSLVRARLSGRNAINSQDIDQTFENLNISKVLGAPNNPNWVLFGYENLCYLDDNIVNLVEKAEEENIYSQFTEATVTRKWIPEQTEISEALINYYHTMCQMILTNEMEARQMSLHNISKNPRIGPIAEWFYNFALILLSKDITYDCLTIRALDLIQVLEGSSICRLSVSERKLKLLVRLLLQRILKSQTTMDILEPLCKILAILCQREPFREFVVLKIEQKLQETNLNYTVPIIMIINNLGLPAIEEIFMNHISLFVSQIAINEALEGPLLRLYSTLNKEKLIDLNVYDVFYEALGDVLSMFIPALQTRVPEIEKKDGNVIYVKSQLIRSRRLIYPRRTKRIPTPISEVFDIPSRKRNTIWDTNERINQTTITIGKKSLLFTVFNQQKNKEPLFKFGNNQAKQTTLTIGKTSLLLPVFKQQKKSKTPLKFGDMLLYNL